MQSPETPSPVPTVAPGVTPTPVTPEPVFYEEVPCSNCTPPESESDFAMNDMPVTGTNRTSDADFGILGDFGGWLRDFVGDIFGWMTVRGEYPNVLVVYLTVMAILYMWFHLRRTRQYATAHRAQVVLERINQIDPDLVEQARVETTFSDLEGRVIIGDWDEDGNSIHDPDRGIRSDYV